MLSPSENAALDQMTLRQDEPSGELVLQQVHQFLGRFVAFPGKHEHAAAALWAVHCHMMDRWESTPRFACLSPEPGSGKTRVLEILELLVPRPVAAINVSPAYLFRRVADENGPPTMLFDEIDTVFGPKAKENEELRAFLNAGHRRGAVAGRCVVRGNTVETEDLPAYCAVAVAGLGWLPDTILSRSVIVRMRRRHAGETVVIFSLFLCRHFRIAAVSDALTSNSWPQNFTASGAHVFCSSFVPLLSESARAADPNTSARAIKINHVRHIIFPPLLLARRPNRAKLLSV